ncbi:hypothetical protein PVAND_001649 [Polypedilum vanderplanki]|uniref:non-specific serine/threonine protein kinase n=1 Tax=Polypedilum vanderplanki TaxID=319348 RepID=A0A9J6BP22_POLVA|nr:hypothetical protein PVAND_001649 [Polypedilum vanderplanki]
MASKPKAAGKKKNGYEAPKKLKPGTILRDNYKKDWKIGVSIGIGGFGEIYSAHDASSATKKLEDYPYVVKIEPHNNGPLFVEMHFYMRVGKKDDIDAFAKSKKLSYIGMPYLVGSGSEEIEGLKHRFLVMPRYGTDIWKIFLQQNRKFPLHTVYRIGWQLTNILEYIHTSGYVHMDIKGANILLGFDKKNGEEQVNLLDFGLACHFNTKEYKNDPKKAHNGTIEYTSRDAHNGVATLRGDFEILAYNIIEWAGAKLPWTASQQILNKPIEVQKMKEEFMKNIDKSLKSAFGSESIPSAITVFVKYVQSLNYDTKPDYQKIRSIFENGLKELKQKNSGKLDFTTTKASTSGVQKRTESKSPQKRPAAAAALSKEDTKKVVKSKKQKITKNDDLIDEDDEPVVRSKRTRERKQYVEDESDSEDEKTVKKPTIKKAQKSKSTPEKNENKSDNESKLKNKKEKSGTAVGQVVLKSKSSSSKKTVQLNFDLDISFDSDLVVTVNRKDRKKKNNDDDAEDVIDKNKTQAGYYKGKFAKTK